MTVNGNTGYCFQGEVINSDGTKKTEVFVLDLPEDLKKPEPGKPLEGTTTSRPNVPSGVAQRSITNAPNGYRAPLLAKVYPRGQSHCFFIKG